MDFKKFAGIAVVALVVLWLIGAVATRKHTPSQTQVVRASPTDKWQISSGRSQMDDSESIVLSLDAQNEIQGPTGIVRPTLMLRCKEKQTSVYIVTGMAADVESSTDEHRVGIRLDNQSPIYQTWPESTDHRALFATDLMFEKDSRGDISGVQNGGVVRFAKALAEAKTLTFEFTPFDGNPQTVRFELEGLRNHIQELSVACGWTAE